MSTQPIHAIDLILKKRDGHELSRREIQFLVDSVVASGGPTTADTGPITDAQIGAFLMAVFQRGLTRAELADLTSCMRFSGETFDSRPLNSFTVDKHSTGGVGDKSSLLIAPALAAAGLEGTPLHLRAHDLRPLARPPPAERSTSLKPSPASIHSSPLARMTRSPARTCHAAMVGQTPKPRARRQDSLRHARPYGDRRVALSSSPPAS